MHVSEIVRYPLRGCAPDSISSVEISRGGIEFDQRWMVVSQTGEPVPLHAANKEKLASIQTFVSCVALELFAPDMQALFVPVADPRCQKMTVMFNGMPREVIDAGDEAAQWLSHYLQASGDQVYRLVYFPNVPEFKDEKDSSGMMEREFRIEQTVLITDAASLAVLNHQRRNNGLAPVEMDSFQPNIVIDNQAAWSELSPEMIRVGEVTFEMVHFNEKSLAVHGRQPSNSDRNPLDTPMFGRYALAIEPGRIQLGDRVEILRGRGV